MCCKQIGLLPSAPSNFLPPPRRLLRTLCPLGLDTLRVEGIARTYARRQADALLTGLLQIAVEQEHGDARREVRRAKFSSLPYVEQQKPCRRRRPRPNARPPPQTRAEGPRCALRPGALRRRRTPPPRGCAGKTAARRKQLYRTSHLGMCRPGGKASAAALQAWWRLTFEW